jgi:hypothetical protein
MKVRTVSFNNPKPPTRQPFKGNPISSLVCTIQRKCSSDDLSKFLQNASRWGEKETIILNGAGKALLAPLLILFNPFIGDIPPYKKENKAYMALKPPTSAIVNSVVQLGAFFGVDKGINYLFKKGALAENFSNIKHLDVLKNRASLAVALVTMPIACTIANKLYSKAANKYLKGKKYA